MDWRKLNNHLVGYRLELGDILEHLEKDDFEKAEKSIELLVEPFETFKKEIKSDIRVSFVNLITAIKEKDEEAALKEFEEVGKQYNTFAMTILEQFKNGEGIWEKV